MQTRSLLLLLLSGLIMFFSGVSIFNKKIKKDKDKTFEISKADSIRFSIDKKDSIQRLIKYKIVPQKINGKLYYIAKFEDRYYTVHILDENTNEIHIVDLFEVKFKLNANYHNPCITGLRRGNYIDYNLTDNDIRGSEYSMILTDSIPISTFVKMSK